MSFLIYLLEYTFFSLIFQPVSTIRDSSSAKCSIRPHRSGREADIARRTENRRQKQQPVRSTSVMENIRGPWRGYPVWKILFRIASVCHCYVWRTDSSSAYPSCIMHPVIMQPSGVEADGGEIGRCEGCASARFANFFCLFCNILRMHRRSMRYPARASIYLNT